MGITRFYIRKTKIVLVGKYRYSKKRKEDILSDFTTWNKWSLGFWFKKNRCVGAKVINTPKSWKNGLVNDYMLGIDLLIFQGWINWNTGGASLDLEKKQKKVEKSKYTYEVIADKLVGTDKVFHKMDENDLIVEIFKATKEEYGDKKAKYLMNVDEDYISDCISEINERLKIKT